MYRFTILAPLVSVGGNREVIRGEVRASIGCCLTGAPPGGGDLDLVSLKDLGDFSASVVTILSANLAVLLPVDPWISAYGSHGCMVSDLGRKRYLVERKRLVNSQDRTVHSG
jgi:hypothetical protein